MVYALLLAFTVVVLAAAGLIHFWGWTGVAIVATAILTLPWTGRLLGSLMMRLYFGNVLRDMAKPLENAEVRLESLEPTSAPSPEELADEFEDEFDDDPEVLADDFDDELGDDPEVLADDFDDELGDDPEVPTDMEAAYGERDWYLLEVTITPDESADDKNGCPPQWDPEMILPFVPSDDGRDDLEDPEIKLCQVVRCEIYVGGAWRADGRIGYGPSRVRFYVGIPRSAERLRFLFCMQTVFGEIALPKRESVLVTS